eukprot:TRINITY_DN5135_c0_g1_i3.p1 TRINITY_DN5135_c0_g1~~TRINITY_DN5135_c0_g1_i3.p1  ORF type:complete len:113 (-),score=9.16 TRINITY_DN5135_c0_g1_i3:2824-3162(-)
MQKNTFFSQLQARFWVSDLEGWIFLLVEARHLCNSTVPKKKKKWKRHQFSMHVKSSQHLLLRGFINENWKKAPFYFLFYFSPLMDEDLCFQFRRSDSPFCGRGYATVFPLPW